MTAVPHNIEMPLFLSSTESKPYASFRTPAKWLNWSCQNWADHCERAHQTDRRSTVNKLTWILGKRISSLEELFILAGMCVLWLTEKTRDSLSKLSRLTHLKCNRYSSQDLTLQGTCFATDSLRLRFFRVRSQKERVISHNAIVSINGGVQKTQTSDPRSQTQKSQTPPNLKNSETQIPQKTSLKKWFYVL